jgi:hypothetical protein
MESIYFNPLYGRPLGHILKQKGVITQSQHGRIVECLSEQVRKQTDKRLGELLVNKGYATQEEIDEALRLQKTPNTELSER